MKSKEFPRHTGMALRYGMTSITAAGNQKRKTTMKHHDPFDLPDDKKKELRKKMKKVLTKKEVFDILDKEIEKIESLPSKTWGFTLDDIIEAIENIKDNLEELEDE
jgi:hypothetical protein